MELPEADATVNLSVAILKSPVANNVPAATVLPEAAATVNLLVLIAKSPVASNVPAILVLPLAAVTVNLLLAGVLPSLIVKLPLFIVVAPPIERVLLKVEAPVTSRVPATVVLPLAEATVNLLVLMSKSPSIPVAPVTANVLLKVAAPVTPKVPATAVLPLVSIVNLLVGVPSLKVNEALSMIVLPPTVNAPPILELPVPLTVRLPP